MSSLFFLPIFLSFSFFSLFLPFPFLSSPFGVTRSLSAWLFIICVAFLLGLQMGQNTTEVMTVVDTHATPVLFYRLDNSLLIGVELAMGKARAAIITQSNASADLVSLKQPSSPFFTFDLTNDGITALPGAFVLRDSTGRVIGALGCSGQYNAEIDVEICTAGYNAAPTTAMTFTPVPSVTLNQAQVVMQAALQQARALNWSL